MSCDLNRSEQQRQILDMASALLGDQYPVSRLRNAKPDDLSALAEFGAFALALPEEQDGSGFSLVDEALMNVLLGRHLVSTKALAASVAVRLAAQLGHGEKARQIANGTIGVCAAVRSDESILLIDAADAALAVVFGKRQVALVDVEGRNAEDVPGLGHSLSVRRLTDAPAAVLGECTAGTLLNIADLLIAAQLLGIAEATRDAAVSYAQLRRQFGRPIGAFQAIKHHCANMALGAEALSSLLDMAAIAVRDERDDAAFQVAALSLLAPRVALANARTCIQVHGGIGFSAEAEPHHYLKQAHLLRQLASGANLLDLPAPLTPYTTLA